MIIEIPDDNSIVKWKKNDKDEWTSAEISDLIKAYEKKPQGDLISRSDALKAVDTRHEELLHDTEYRRKHCQIDLLGIKKHILAIPPANVLKTFEGDLISREALKSELTRLGWTEENGFKNRYVLDDIIDNVQAVEITEEQAINKLHETGWLIGHDKEMTTRPQGEWIETSDFDEFYGKVYKCTNCNKETLGCSCHNYCPNCGADMREGIIK